MFLGKFQIFLKKTEKTPFLTSKDGPFKWLLNVGKTLNTLKRHRSDCEFYKPPKRVFSSKMHLLNVKDVKKT